MNYDYIEKIEFNTKDQLYDLTITTFSGTIDFYKIGYFLANRRHAMRMDLISFDLYSSNKYVGVLSDLNQILNPYSVREGDVIMYLPIEELERLSNVPDAVKYGETAKLKADLIDVLKKKKPDISRLIFNNTRSDTDSLPPSVSTDNTPQIQIDNGKILISPNAYKNPKSEPITEAEAEELDIKITPEDTIERVLVRKYTKYND